nr:MAG TPA: hypothetical protein [Caudoviricetes sp.]
MLRYFVVPVQSNSLLCFRNAKIRLKIDIKNTFFLSIYKPVTA